MAHRKDYNDRRGDYSRRDPDPRERSPNRHGASVGNYGRQNDRHNDRDHRPGGFHGSGHNPGGFGGNSHRGQGQTATRGGPPPSNLPPLPPSVPVPKNAKSLLDALAPRSPVAKAGRPIEVLTNHFQIQSLPIVSINEYELRFSLTAESRRGPQAAEMSPALIRKAFDAATRAGIFGPFVCHNNVSLLWSPEEIIPRHSEQRRNVDLPGHTVERPNVVAITMRHSGRAKIRNLVDRFTEAPDLNIDSGMTWLNALFRTFPASQDGWAARPKGLSFFIREAGLYMQLPSTGGVLEALRGLHQGVSTHFNCLSVNVDTATTAFYTPDNGLIQVALAFAGCDPQGDPLQLLRLGANDIREVSEKIAGMYFYVTHDGEARKKEKIKARGLWFDNGRISSSIQATFSILNKDGSQAPPITVQKYFEDKYGRNCIKFPELPLIDSRKGLFPIEVCKTTAGERYRSVLEGKETADFIKFATAPAFQRSAQIEECVKRLGWHNQDLLAQHGVSVVPKMMKVSARLMSPPIIHYGPGSEATNPRNGSWNLRNKKFVNSKGLASWGVLYVPNNRSAVSPQEFVSFFQTFHRQFISYGLTPPRDDPAVVYARAQFDIKLDIDQVARETCKKFRSNRPDMIFVFLHETAPVSVYKTIKSVAEVEYGIPTQVMVVEKSIRGRGNPAQYLGNVCMKVNAKLGGVNSIVPLPTRFASGGMMIVGADVTHPSPAQLAMAPPPPSIAALTGSFDPNCCRYTAVAAPQASTRESLSAGASMPVFVSMFQTLIDRFEKRNQNRKPVWILYFRDGVADSQIPELKSGEVKLLREACAKFGGKLTAIVAQKRHHTRFFPIGRSEDRNGNVAPGTVVESGKNSSFVLGHGALQGTVRPSHYVIVHDDIGLTKDEFHQLVMHGVHSYGKATRAVHTHSAIYYADIVAERATARFRQRDGNTFFVDVHERLQGTQWWL